MVGESPGALIESNLVLNLNEPSKIADTSWIRPGKVQFPWWNGYHMPNATFKAGLNTATLKAYIDFSAEYGIPYHSLDGTWQAWYGGPVDPYGGQDITKAIPQIDLPAVLDYAKSKGVRTRIWVHWKGLEKQMDRALATYAQWGVEGIMVDFMNRDDQEMVNFYHEVLQKAARHRLTVTFHGSYKPTGLQRTYPNFLTSEGVLNTEHNKWGKVGSTPEHELLVPFVRMLAGPLDFHQGGFRPVMPESYRPRDTAPNVQGTLTRALALYVVYENPMPMLVDHPAAYTQRMPAFRFLQQVPTVWDETKVVNAAVGEHLTIARRSGEEWYIGSMTDRNARRLEIPLSFLGPGRYVAEVYADSPEASLHPEKVDIQRRLVWASDTIVADLAPAGGHVARLFPAPR